MAGSATEGEEGKEGEQSEEEDDDDIEEEESGGLEVFQHEQDESDGERAIGDADLASDGRQRGL